MRLSALLLAATLALPAAAQDFDPAQMDADQRAAFGAAVRSYLLQNPTVLMEAIAVLEQQEADAAASQDAALVSQYADELFDGGDWIGGNPDGDVTVVEFLDYRCGYCRQAHPEVRTLLQEDGEIRYIVKEFPILGEQSVMASRYALAVREVEGDAAYAGTQDTLMSMRMDVSLSSLQGLAEDAGYDWGAIQTAMEGEAVNSSIGDNLALGQALGLQGTPSFVFGDQMVRGYVPLSAMEEIVSAERG